MMKQEITKDEELKAMEETIHALSLEIQESGAVSERICKSYAVLKAHQNQLLKEVFGLLNDIEGDDHDRDAILSKVESVKKLVLTDIGKHKVMH
jgi:hypothetical protein